MFRQLGVGFSNLVFTQCPSRCFSTTTMSCRTADDRKMMLKSMPKRDEGIQGAEVVDIDNIVTRSALFPDESSPFKLYNGTQFNDLPVCNIKVSKNNTIITVCDSKGTPKLIRSCGVEGFKNTRKGTNIAAQATAISIATRAIEQGFNTLRVTVQGLGAGRMSAIKGLTMGGLKVVSITDTTPVSWNPPRPRKPKRL